MVDWIDDSSLHTPPTTHPQQEVAAGGRLFFRSLSRRRLWWDAMLKPREFPETRASLLATVQEGAAPAAWQELFHSYAPAVYRVARLRGLAEHDADDVVQQVMMDLARQMGRSEYDAARGRFRTWVRSITEHKIANILRQPRLQSVELATEAADESVSMEDIWAKEWRLQDLLECLDQVAADFAPRRVEAFRLYVLEGLSATDVAARLGMTVGHVYVTRTQILKRIRQRLQRMNPAEEA